MREAWDSMLLAGARAAGEPTLYLREYPAVRPQVGQTRVLGYCLAVVGSALGELGDPAFVWRAAPHTFARAQTSQAGNGRGGEITVDVRADLRGVELAEVLAHELAHCAQLASGRWHTMTRPAREEEAVRFAAAFMHGDVL